MCCSVTRQLQLGRICCALWASTVFCKYIKQVSLHLFTTLHPSETNDIKISLMALFQWMSNRKRKTPQPFWGITYMTVVFIWYQSEYWKKESHFWMSLCSLNHLCVDSYFLSQSFLEPGLLVFSLYPFLPILHITVESYKRVRLDVLMVFLKHSYDVKVKSLTLRAR